ncbi:hypothetical protein HK099_005738, partial [Clydaea vesicula]
MIEKLSKISNKTVNRFLHRESVVNLANHPIWNSSALVEKYSRQPIVPVTLSWMRELGETHSIRESASYLHKELPKRLARRVKALQNLPFIVGENPYIKSIYHLYSASFEKLRTFPPIDSSEMEDLFSDTLLELVETHQDVIPNLAKGFAECGHYMSKGDRTKFLDGLIHARIGLRVLAENHLALNDEDPEWAGVVHKNFKPALLISSIGSYCQNLCRMNYGTAPEFVINGQENATFPYIPVHLDYIMMELMKNAMRATVEHSQKIGRVEHPDIEITVVSGKEEICIRLRDQGGGIPSHCLPFIFDYSFTTVPKIEEEDLDVFSAQSRMQMISSSGGPMAGLGFGLPMSK